MCQQIKIYKAFACYHKTWKTLLSSLFLFFSLFFLFSYTQNNFLTFHTSFHLFPPTHSDSSHTHLHACTHARTHMRSTLISCNANVSRATSHFFPLHLSRWLPLATISYHQSCQKKLSGLCCQPLTTRMVVVGKLLPAKELKGSGSI